MRAAAEAELGALLERERRERAAVEAALSEARTGAGAAAARASALEEQLAARALTRSETCALLEVGAACCN